MPEDTHPGARRTITMYRRVGMYTIVLLLISNPLQGEDRKVGTRTVDLSTNYWVLYPRREDVSIESIEPMLEGIAVCLTLRSSMDDLSHFLYSTNQEPFERSTDGKIVVQFEDNHTPEAQKTTTIKNSHTASFYIQDRAPLTIINFLFTPT